MFAPRQATSSLYHAIGGFNTATELEAMVSVLPNEKSRQLVQLRVKASHKQAKEFREVAQKG